LVRHTNVIGGTLEPLVRDTTSEDPERLKITFCHLGKIRLVDMTKLVL